jgi:translation initiation factor IF-2
MVLLKHCLIRSLNYLLKNQINIIHKGVGAITETDVMLLLLQMQLLSDLMFVLLEMRQLADKEEIDIRYYSII